MAIFIRFLMQWFSVVQNHLRNWVFESYFSPKVFRLSISKYHCCFSIKSIAELVRVQVFLKTQVNRILTVLMSLLVVFVDFIFSSQLSIF